MATLSTRTHQLPVSNQLHHPSPYISAHNHYSFKCLGINESERQRPSTKEMEMSMVKI